MNVKSVSVAVHDDTISLVRNGLRRRDLRLRHLQHLLHVGVHPAAARGGVPHRGAARATPRPAASSRSHRHNLEVAPLLTILSSDQKDLLILRAAAQPALADLLLGMAAEPISPEEAAARVEALSDGAAAEVAVRSYLEIGATENALTLLGALSEAVQEALEALAEVALPAGGGGASSVEASEWQSGDEIAAVEQLPSAGSVAVLWREVLAAARRSSTTTSATSSARSSTACSRRRPPCVPCCPPSSSARRRRRRRLRGGAQAARRRRRVRRRRRRRRSS